MKHTLVILDDHSIVRKGLKSWIEENSDWKVIFLTENAEETLAFLDETAQKSRTF